MDILELWHPKGWPFILKEELNIKSFTLHWFPGHFWSRNGSKEMRLPGSKEWSKLLNKSSDQTLLPAPLHYLYVSKIEILENNWFPFKWFQVSNCIFITFFSLRKGITIEELKCNPKYCDWLEQERRIPCSFPCAMYLNYNH